MIETLPGVKHAENHNHRTSFLLAICWILVQAMTGELALGQALTTGPVVGGVTDTTAKVFVRTDQEGRVVVRTGTDPNLQTYQESPTAATSLDSDFTTIIPLGHLSADTTYYLNVIVNDIPQLSAPFPSFKTFAPIRTSRNFNFVVLTDFETVRNLTTTVATFASAAATSPAFAFIGGDFDHRNPLNIFNKRKMFKDLYDGNNPFMADFVNLILRRTPIVHQWDDHDTGANNIDKNYRRWNVNQQVFEEYVPSYPFPSVTPGIWQSFRYAQVDGFVLDCRSQRDPENDPDDANKSMLDGNNLGTSGQLQWLENGLLASTAQWKIVFSSVTVNPTTKFPDGWAGYQTEWNALKDFINTNNIQGVVFISGDLHLSAIDDGTQSGFPEMAVPEPNTPQLSNQCATGPEGTWSEGFYDDTCSGFGLVTIEKNPNRLTLQTVDEFGNIRISYTVSGRSSALPHIPSHP